MEKGLHTLSKLLSRTWQQGSTIIELLIAVMIVGLIITAVATAATYSIKNTGESRYRQVATILGQEVLEYFRGRKNELGIINLSNSLNAGDNCYSDIESPTVGLCNSIQVISMAGTDFRRDVSIVKGGSGSHADPQFVTFTVTVSWIDGNETREIELIQELQQDSGFTD